MLALQDVDRVAVRHLGGLQQLIDGRGPAAAVFRHLHGLEAIVVELQTYVARRLPIHNRLHERFPRSGSISLASSS
jgi:hypothetical protein